MGYYLFYLFFAFIICLAYGFSFYLYLLLELAVKKKKEVPNWFYRIGQSMQDRIHRVKLEDRTNYDALKQSRFFLRGMLLYFSVLSLPKPCYFFHSFKLRKSAVCHLLCDERTDTILEFRLHSKGQKKLLFPKLCRKRMLHHQLGFASSFCGKHGANTVSHFVSIENSVAVSAVTSLFLKSFSFLVMI